MFILENWQEFYANFLIGMVILAGIIFVVLQFVTPAYGMTFSNKWGASIKSKTGWYLIEIPVFLLMLAGYLCSLFVYNRPFNFVTFAFFVLFMLHYGQRGFVFPSLMKGNSRIPIATIIFGIIFNIANAFMQAGWFYYFSPESAYPIQWLWSPQFIIGTILFFTGMVINMHSDRVIRQLRKNKFDNNYYLPQRFLFKKINSANYTGELIEWLGFAILTWSWSGLVFFIWTFANIVPRARVIYEKYTLFFGDEFTQQKRWKICPYIY